MYTLRLYSSARIPLNRSTRRAASLGDPRMSSAEVRVDGSGVDGVFGQGGGGEERI